MTYKEAVYMCMDLLKISNDDADFNENHLVFLLDKYRALLLNKYYANNKKYIPEANYQEICIPTQVCEGDECDPTYLKSIDVIPNILNVGNISIYPVDIMNAKITLVSLDRLKFTGYNKWLKNIIYCAIGPDRRLWFKSSNPQHKYLENVKIRAVFDSPSEAYKYNCCDDHKCDVLDQEIPLEEAFCSTLITAVVDLIRNVLYDPADDINNSNSDLSDLQTYIARHLKKPKLQQVTTTDADDNG